MAYNTSLCTGWWMVENEAKCMAWFPAPYLEKVDADLEDETDDNDGGNSFCKKALLNSVENSGESRLSQRAKPKSNLGL